MTLNPLQFANEVNNQYLRYQLTSSRLADDVLASQFQDQLWQRNSPLVKGPYASISRAFQEGARVEDLIDEGVLHPRMREIIEYPSLYKHQEEALRGVVDEKDVLITTGTGSGKTEAFLYPIINRCLRLNEEPTSAKGVTAVIVYPMNALAYDQLERLREYLVGTGVTFGMYTGDTPEEETNLPFEGKPLPEGTTRGEYKEKREEADRENLIHLPPEERYTRQQIREDPPQILLVNKAILEFQLTRGSDLGLFLDAPIEFLVMDEAHTNTGAHGAEVAMLLRRLKALASPPKGRITHLATSATIVDEEHEDAGERFISRLFGCPTDDVLIVHESYQEQDWPTERTRPSPPPDPTDLFERALQAVSLDDEDQRIAEVDLVFEELTGKRLPPGDNLPARLFDGLLGNEIAYQLWKHAITVRPLQDLVEMTWSSADRGPIHEGATEEALTYLVLGAAAEKEETPLFRPKLHYFVKGIEGAVVVLHKGDNDRPTRPELFLSPDKAAKKYQERREPTAMFPVVVCPQCGQHHYEQHLQDVTSNENDPLTGGEQVDGGTMFRPDSDKVGHRVLFTDAIVKDQNGTETATTKRHNPACVCYLCGALHRGDPKRCGRCERPGTLLDVHLLDEVDRVKSCPVCSYSQGAARYYQDPFRALQEVSVANVYVLAQDMLNQADKQGERLIVFADNRQEAAFQAGWMQDRARRYRFRQLLYRHLVQDDAYEQDDSDEQISIEATVDKITKALNEDKELAKLIAPEVFEENLESYYDTQLREDLERFVRVHLLREVTTSYRTRASLETWGKLNIRYGGLNQDHERIQDLAAQYNLSPEDLTRWLRTLLDTFRKRQILHHQRTPIFSRKWSDRTDLTKKRYLPPIEFRPTGLRLEHPPDAESTSYVKVWIGKQLTGVQYLAEGLKFDNDTRDAFLEDIWTLLTDDLGLLVRLDALTYEDSGQRISGTQGVYQIDALKIGITKQDQRYECTFCGRIHPRTTPNQFCTRYRCTDGRLEPLEDTEPRDYDLQLLETADTFVLPEEHTAQVPNDQRNRIERAFKEGEGVNCLVATPTLELGVDIGALDMVLLRNVPPTAANYWQRAGRAGRRNRMAVIYTYARTNPHDLHFFKDPTKLLGGDVLPPQFNLRNSVMVRKHVHAAVLTHLHAELQDEQDPWLDDVIPTYVGQILFDGDNTPRDELASLVQPLQDHLDDPDRRERILEQLEHTFTHAWPTEDQDEVSPEQLETYVDEMTNQLRLAYKRLLDRAKWASKQIRRLAAKEADGETLTEEEERFKRRCKETLKRLNPNLWGSEDRDKYQLYNYTLSVLSREGFLPGHASSTDHVVASADRAFTKGWDRFEFDLDRPKPIAIHEHVPGNRIYANGGKYQVNYYNLPAESEVKNPPTWDVNLETFAAHREEQETATYNDPDAVEVQSIPLSDSFLTFVSHVEDLETTRFRMPSVITGVLQRRHDGGHQHQFDDRTVEHRENQLLTLLNLGPARSDEQDDLGFPICKVCGGTRSPYEDEREIQRFIDYHTKHCGETPTHLALHIHTHVDGLLFHDLDSQAEAVSLGEALTLIGSHLFDMERDDLRVLALPRSEDDWSLFLYDPMPGGSGLLQQLISEWDHVLQAAQDLLKECPGACAASCYDCLRTYYNQFYHEELDRHLSLSLLTSMGKAPKETTIIEGVNEVPDADDGQMDTNIWEKRLEQIVREEWGFANFQPQIKVELPEISAYTIPDLAHEEAQVAIYLDGPHHAEREEQDRFLRNGLQAEGWDVIEILIQDFENDQMMKVHRQRISRKLDASR